VVLTVTIFVILLASLIALLKTNGVFNVIDVMVSPDGKTQTVVFNKTKNSHFTEEGFTITDYGNRNGSTIYVNAEYVGLWWSPDSCYYLVDMDRNGKQEMYLADFTKNISCNMLSYLDLAMHGHPEFDNAIVVEAWKQIEYEFIRWDTKKAKLHLAFRYDTTDGGVCEGTLWYDCAMRTISDIVIN